MTNVEPEGAEVSLTWTSADTTLATVDAEGNVYGKKPNNDVVVTAQDAAGMVHECVVHVLIGSERLDVLFLPAGLTVIEEEAFEGCDQVIIDRMGQ